MRIKLLLKIVYLISAALMVVAVYLGFDIYRYGNQTQTKVADAIIVLGASVWGKEPSPVFQARIDHGIRLYQNGFGKRLIFTGGKRPGNRFTEAVVAKRYAQRKRVPGSAIIVETKSRTTEENLYYAKQLATQASLSSFNIVSDPLHMRRAIAMAQDLGLTAFASPTPTTRYIGWKSKLTFLAREVYFYGKYLVCGGKLLKR